MLAATVATFEGSSFRPEDLVEAKRGRTVTVCLPARDEHATVGRIVQSIRADLMDDVPLVDEVLVVDDGSLDATVPVARRAGARVVAAGGGKGDAMWTGVRESAGDVVVFCDADLRSFESAFVTGLLGPVLTDHAFALVKGCYTRPYAGRAGEGGRVTELVAKPLLRVLFPPLSGMLQPLSGELAAPREVLEAVPFVKGYGVDIGLLIDVANEHGAQALAQVDLGQRVHRNRPLAELAPQAEAVVRTVLARAGLGPAVAERPPPGEEPRRHRGAACP